MHPGRADWHTTFSILAILAGAVILLVTVWKTRPLFAALPLLAEPSRSRLSRLLSVSRALMALFFWGYLAVAFSYATDHPLVGKLFTSLIFLAGALFVFLGFQLHARMLEEIQRTISGLVPICLSCKKIRREGAEPLVQDSWTEIETYIASRTTAKFSHGICPDCLQKIREKKGGKA